MLRTTYFWVDILLFGHWGTIETIFRLRKLLDSRRHHPVASVVEQNQLCCHVILYSTCLYSSSSSSHLPRPREMSYCHCFLSVRERPILQDVDDCLVLFHGRHPPSSRTWRPNHRPSVFPLPHNGMDSALR
jgi:hypothetical protein